MEIGCRRRSAKRNGNGEKCIKNEGQQKKEEICAVMVTLADIAHNAAYYIYKPLKTSNRIFNTNQSPIRA